MPKPNFQFEKRRREMMKAQKKEEKRLRKLNKDQVAADTTSPPATPSQPAGEKSE